MVATHDTTISLEFVLVVGFIIVYCCNTVKSHNLGTLSHSFKFANLHSLLGLRPIA